MEGREQFSRQIAERADAIEAELRRVGLWEPKSPPQAQLRFTKPYAADTLSFPQWLQFIFLPRVRDLLKSGKEFPRGSAIADYAADKLGPKARDGKLLKALQDFDSAIAPDDDDFYAEAAGRRKWTTGALATVWTAGLLVLGTAFALALPLLAPRQREEVITFSATEPAVTNFDLLAFALVRDIPTGPATRQALRAKVYRGNKTIDNAGLTVDPRTLSYSYQDAGGQTISGKLGSDAVLAWLKRNEVNPSDPPARQRLDDDAKDLLQITQAIQQTAAADAKAVAATLRPESRVGAKLDLSAARTAATDKPARISPWLRWGLPFGVWLVGLLVILLIARKRAAGAAA